MHSKNLSTKSYRDNDSRAPRTPWGPAQHETIHAPGIVFYSTAGHGGFQVSPELQAQMPAHDRAEWFEEDCEWSRVVLAFPQHFEQKHVEMAQQTYKQWCADTVPFSKR